MEVANQSLLTKLLPLKVYVIRLSGFHNELGEFYRHDTSRPNQTKFRKFVAFRTDTNTDRQSVRERNQHPIELQACGSSNS